MTTPKALLSSLSITIISLILISISRGVIPTAEKAAGEGFGMSVFAFVIFRFFFTQGSKGPQGPEG